MKIFHGTKRFKLYLWIGFAFFLLWLIIDTAYYSGPFLKIVLNNIWRVVYIITINFIFFEKTVPFIQRRKKIFVKVLLFLFAAWIQLMLYSFGLFAWGMIGMGIGVYTELNTGDNPMEGVAHAVSYSIFSFFFFGIIIHVYDHIQLKQSAQLLRIEKQLAELNYLKSQTNPHFLFNTLNNIYALARDKSDLAPESILQLSKILRFMLYETGGAFIPVEQELKIISDYIALEKLRYDDSLRVNYNYDVEDMKQALPPLLLIPLVENAFKHGVSETRNDPFVEIHLSIKQRQLTFTVKNSSDKLQEDKIVKENIGLSNLKRQLELLFKEYDLFVQQGDSVFIAILKINLASHV